MLILDGRLFIDRHCATTIVLGMVETLPFLFILDSQQAFSLSHKLIAI